MLDDSALVSHIQNAGERVLWTGDADNNAKRRFGDVTPYWTMGVFLSSLLLAMCLKSEFDGVNATVSASLAAIASAAILGYLVVGKWIAAEGSGVAVAVTDKALYVGMTGEDGLEFSRFEIASIRRASISAFHGSKRLRFVSGRRATTVIGLDGADGALRALASLGAVGPV